MQKVSPCHDIFMHHFRHAGDLGNVIAAPDGSVHAQITDSVISLEDGNEYNIMGRAIVVSIPLVYVKVSLRDDVIKWKYFLRYWPFVRGIHRWSVNSPHKGQWRGTLMFSLICTWINRWVNNGDAGDLRRHSAHFDVIVMACGPNGRHLLAVRGMQGDCHVYPWCIAYRLSRHELNGRHFVDDNFTLHWFSSMKMLE